MLGLVPWSQRRDARPPHRHAVRPALAALVRAHDRARRCDLLGAHLPARRGRRAPPRRRARRSCSRPPTCSTSRCGRFRWASGCAASWRRRVLHGPEVLFLDEPTIGLDLLAKQRFREMVRAAERGAGHDPVLTSHDVADIEHVADRVVVINHGTIIYDDQVQRMRTTLLQTKLLEVRFEEPPGELAMDGVEVTPESDTVYAARRGHAPAVGAGGARRAARRLRDRRHLGRRSAARAGHLRDLRGPDVTRDGRPGATARPGARCDQPGELAVRVAFYARDPGRVRGAVVGGHARERRLDRRLRRPRARSGTSPAAEGAVIATKPRMIETIGWDIASGAIVIEMLRPVSVVGLRLAAELGEAVVRLACAWVVGATVVVALRRRRRRAPPRSRWRCRRRCSRCAATWPPSTPSRGAAFWLRDARSTWFLYQKLVFLLGGMLLPLEFLPRALADVARALPFAAMAYAPARLASGHVEPWLLAVQFGLARRAARLRGGGVRARASGGWRWWADERGARHAAHRVCRGLVEPARVLVPGRRS